MNRLLLALRCFFAVLFYYRLPAAAVALLPPPDLRLLPEPEPPPPVEVKEARQEEPPVAAEPVPPRPEEREAERHRGAVQVLSILQREGRLIDFLMESVDGYDDAQIGAAVRDIHRGCKKGLVEHFQIAPVRPEPDEAAVRIEEGYDPSRIRLIGNIGRPPFHGTLRHHGWAAKKVLLPELPKSHDPMVITPAEVELGG